MRSRAQFIRTLDESMPLASVEQACVDAGYERPSRQAVYAARRYATHPSELCGECGRRLPRKQNP